MNTTTIITGIAGSIGTTSATVNDDGSTDTEKRNSTLVPIAASSATTAVGGTINAHQVEEIYEKYATCVQPSLNYVQALSDDDLVEALQKMDLLALEKEPKTDAKTI